MEENISLRILNLAENLSGIETFPEERSKNVATDLRLAMLRLVSEHLNESTGAANFVALAKTDEFISFKKISEKLIHCNPTLLSDDESKAFFINIYNVLTWHALAVYYHEMKVTTPIESVLNIPHFWERFGYRIGEYSFSLDDIEHGVLRGNAAHPSSKKMMFEVNDPRCKLAASSVDPRIHFALNCGAKSCPVVRVYSSQNLDQKLDEVSRSYLLQEVSVEKCPEGDVLLLPQILEWYSADFAPTETGVLRWMLRYMEGGIKDVIESLIEEEDKGSTNRVRYFYNWTLNQKL